MAKPTYLDSGIDDDLVRLIKDGAIFIRPAGTQDIPTGTDWTPTDADTQIGYYSEDGFTLTPNAGDATDFLAHNGDIVKSEQDPGFWAVAFSAIEGNETVTSAYFGVDVDPSDGSVTVTSAAASRRYDLVTVGMDDQERLIVVHYPSVQVSEREALTFNRTTLLASGLTFRTFRGTGAANYHFKAWGFVPGFEEEEEEG